MVRFRTRTRTRASETIKVGPFRFTVAKTLGRRGARFSFSAPLGGARRRNVGKRRWR